MKLLNYLYFRLLSYCHNTITIVLAALLAIPLQSRAQVTPTEGSELNYRIIGFSFPEKPTTTEYQLEIASGYCANEKEFAGKVFTKIPVDRNRVIAEVPAFGSVYTWRVVYQSGKSARSTTNLYHFTTNIYPLDSNTLQRLRIKQNSAQPTEGYIFIDGFNAMYDMNGAPVWHMRDNDSLTLDADVKASTDGGVTFLSKSAGYELGYDGNLLWKTNNHNNSGTNIGEHISFHHELTRLDNGHFMTLMAQGRNHRATLPGAATVPGGRKRFFPSMTTSSVVELDQQGNTVWTWDCAEYVQHSDLMELKARNPGLISNIHENAFFFDQKEGVLYVSLSDISRIVKIEYPSGKVLSEYGSKFDTAQLRISDSAENGNIIRRYTFHNKSFSHQHALEITGDHCIYLYNNNEQITADKGQNYPQVVKINADDPTLENVWVYDCRLAADGDFASPGGGGNVRLLANGNLFVSMCSPYNNLFITDSNNNILWNAVPETYHPEQGAWRKSNIYRASFVSRQQLEQMIWRGTIPTRE